MPTVRNYNAGSIVYFQEDRGGRGLCSPKRKHYSH